MLISDFVNASNNKLKRLSLGHWRVKWLPNPSSSTHGRAFPETNLIEIYDLTQEEALETLFHEVVEIKLRDSLRPYRVMVNKLIEGFQELSNVEKDKFIEELPLICEVFQEFPPDV